MLTQHLGRVFLPSLIPLSLVSGVCSIVIGCGGYRSVPGGTEGLLQSDGEPIAGIEVTIHELNETSWEVIGSGVSLSDGTFVLRSPLAEGPLWLQPGEYRVTLASVRPDFVALPVKYLSVLDTPFEVDWSSSDTMIELDFSLSKPHSRR